jgi:hypothetical protein
MRGCSAFEYVYLKRIGEVFTENLKIEIALASINFMFCYVIDEAPVDDLSLYSEKVFMPTLSAK